MFRTLVLSCCLLYIPLILILLKGTFLEVSWHRKSFGGIILGKEIFLLILPGIVLYSFDIYRNYVYFYVTEESMHEATIYALYAVLVFCISIAFICKGVFRKTFLAIRSKPVLLPKDVILIYQIYKVTIIFIVLIAALLLLAGMRHAFISSILSGGDLMATRLQNRYDTGVPTVVMSFFRFLYIFGGILFGLSYSQLNRTQRVIGGIIIIFAVTFFGDKAPVFSVVVLAILAHLSISEKISTANILKNSVIMGVTSMVILYAVAYLQFGGINPAEFLEFLIARAGLGQIGGFYEQFALKLHNPAYIWHSIPFANFVLDYPVYNKDLMMSMWGLNVSEHETGVVNSLFVGEAYAIGGYLLALLSPIIVAINYCAAIIFLTYFFRKFFGLSRGGARITIQLLIPSIFVLTGDIAGLLAAKLLIMTLFFVGAIWILQNILYRKHAGGNRNKRISFQSS